MISEIRILGHVVQIETFGRDGTAHKGECEYDRNEIRIGDWLHDSMAEATLLHEIVHFIDDCLDLNLSEEQVAGVAQGLYQVLCDNPEFLRRKK